MILYVLVSFSRKPIRSFRLLYKDLELESKNKNGLSLVLKEEDEFESLHKASIINFLTEKGPEEPYVKKLNHLLVLDVIDPSFFSDKSKESYETWYITYTVEGDSMTVSSNDIPADESGTNFAEEVVFTKSE